MGTTRTSIRRRIAALRRRASSVDELGDEPVRIDDLVSPLRYDVLVRERFFRLLLDEEASGDRPALIARASSEPYFTWFRQIAIPRFHPGLVGDEDAIAEAFAERVDAAAELCASFSATGYDPRQPITLRTGRELVPTSTGKRLGRRIHAGDGCHRLALLRLHGVSVLEPGSYRLQVERRFAPLDNTAELIPLLGLDAESYFTFLALSYAPGTDCRTKEELLRQVRLLNPDLEDELAQVLAFDLPLIDAVEDSGTAGAG